jgi:hypothetical protein
VLSDPVCLSEHGDAIPGEEPLMVRMENDGAEIEPIYLVAAIEPGA